MIQGSYPDNTQAAIPTSVGFAAYGLFMDITAIAATWFQDGTVTVPPNPNKVIKKDPAFGKRKTIFIIFKKADGSLAIKGFGEWAQAKDKVWTPAKDS